MILFVLRSVDQRLFHEINSVWTASWLDPTMISISNLHRMPFVIGPLAAIFLWLYLERGVAARAIANLGILIGTVDAACYRILKPFWAHARPEHAGISVILRNGHHGGPGFPSNHAANCFAGACFLGAIYPKLKYPLLGAAVLVAHSRIYLGDHFPSDVIGGAAVGWAAGWIAARIAAGRIASSPGGFID